MTSIKNEIKTWIELNDIDKLDEILSNKKTLNELKNHKYFDVYVCAIKLKKLNLIKYFHRKGFELNCVYKLNKRKHTDDESDTPETYVTYSNALIEAIKWLDLKAINLLIELNASLNSTDYRHVPLQIAYNLYQKYKLNENQANIKKCYKIVKLLLINNANSNIYNNDGLRLIHQVTLDKNLEILKLLLKSATINVNVLTYRKMQNALHLITETRKQRRMNQNASTNADEDDDVRDETDDDDDNDADTTINDSYMDSDTSNDGNPAENIDDINIKMAKLLIKSNCNMNHRDLILHETPIFKAIALNDYNLVKLYVQEGIDISLRNIYGNDALSRSIQLGRFRIARLLITLNAPIRKSTCFYKMPRNDELNRRIFLNQPQQSLNDTHNQQQHPSSNIHYFENADDEDDANIFYEYDNNVLANQLNSVNRENMLMLSLSKYEEFLKFLKLYTNDRPRSLLDLSRLKVRELLRKPISNHLYQLSLPIRLYDYILLKDTQL